eukprot:m51a1_g2305 hypothetical protein (387) ;mRNA; r:450844-452367
MYPRPAVAVFSVVSPLRGVASPRSPAEEIEGLRFAPLSPDQRSASPPRAGPRDGSDALSSPTPLEDTTPVALAPHNVDAEALSRELQRLQMRSLRCAGDVGSPEPRGGVWCGSLRVATDWGQPQGRQDELTQEEEDDTPPACTDDDDLAAAASAAATAGALPSTAARHAQQRSSHDVPAGTTEDSTSATAEEGESGSQSSQTTSEDAEGPERQGLASFRVGIASPQAPRPRSPGVMSAASASGERGPAEGTKSGRLAASAEELYSTAHYADAEDEAPERGSRQQEPFVASADAALPNGQRAAGVAAADYDEFSEYDYGYEDEDGDGDGGSEEGDGDEGEDGETDDDEVMRAARLNLVGVAQGTSPAKLHAGAASPLEATCAFACEK